MPDGDEDSIPAEVSAPPPEETPPPPPKVDADPADPKTAVAAEKGDAPPQTVHGYNYTLAFVLMVNGMNLAEVAKELNFDYQKLCTRARREKWRVLAHGSYDRLFRKDRAERIEPKKGEMAEQVEKRIKQISSNRDRVVAMADDLRGLINKVAVALNKLDLQNADDEKLGNVSKSIGSLTKAAKDIADMTMVALGDEHAIRHLGAGHNKPGGGNNGPTMIINMPGILATSRRRMVPAERVDESKQDLEKTERRVASLNAGTDDDETDK